MILPKARAWNDCLDLNIGGECNSQEQKWKMGGDGGRSEDWYKGELKVCPPLQVLCSSKTFSKGLHVEWGIGSEFQMIKGHIYPWAVISTGQKFSLWRLRTPLPLLPGCACMGTQQTSTEGGKRSLGYEARPCWVAPVWTHLGSAQNWPPQWWLG